MYGITVQIATTIANIKNLLNRLVMELACGLVFEIRVEQEY
jgi:hypothetical protein